MLETWCSAVLRLMYNVVAICGLVNPAATSAAPPPRVAEHQVWAPPPPPRSLPTRHPHARVRSSAAPLAAGSAPRREGRHGQAQRGRVAAGGLGAGRLVGHPSERTLRRPRGLAPVPAGERLGTEVRHRLAARRPSHTPSSPIAWSHCSARAMASSISPTWARSCLPATPASARPRPRPQALEMAGLAGELQRLVEQRPDVTVTARRRSHPSVLRATNRRSPVSAAEHIEGVGLRLVPLAEVEVAAPEPRHHVLADVLEVVIRRTRSLR